MQKYITISLLACLFLISGCISMESLQNGMDKIDDTWKVANNNLLKTAGTREYNINKKQAFNAMVITLTELGYIVENIVQETGFIIAKAPIPAPLTHEEWQKVKKIEEPAMQALVTSEVGEMYASMYLLSDSNFDTIMNIHMLEHPKGLQISVRFILDYTGPSIQGFAYGQQPPPGAVKLALAKFWETFEKTLFIQGGTFK